MEYFKRELENKNLCSTCGGVGGLCCRAGGCVWFPSDFREITLNSIDSLLQNGKASIVGTPNTTLKGTTPIFNGVTLSLRARNINRGPIDLISIPTCCASLTETGCEFDFEHRPSGGKHLIPMPNLDCYEDFNIKDIENEWYVYNKILSKLVRRYTGRSVNDEYRREVIEFLYSWGTIALREVSKQRVDDCQTISNLFVLMFPEETKLAEEKIKKDNLVLKRDLYKH